METITPNLVEPESKAYTKRLTDWREGKGPKPPKYRSGFRVGDTLVHAGNFDLLRQKDGREHWPATYFQFRAEIERLLSEAHQEPYEWVQDDVAY